VFERGCIEFPDQARFVVGHVGAGHPIAIDSVCTYSHFRAFSCGYGEARLFTGREADPSYLVSR
jgi:hypothetical protein